MNSVLEPLGTVTDHREIQDWCERFELWVMTKKEIKDDRSRCAHFLTMIGKNTYALIKDLSFPVPPCERPFTELRDILLNHYKPANFEAAERAKFHCLVRKLEQ